MEEDKERTDKELSFLTNKIKERVRKRLQPFKGTLVSPYRVNRPHTEPTEEPSTSEESN